MGQVSQCACMRTVWFYGATLYTHAKSWPLFKKQFGAVWVQ